MTGTGAVDSFERSGVVVVVVVVSALSATVLPSLGLCNSPGRW